jgi:hypothetical protein
MRRVLRIYSWKPRHGLNFGDHIGPQIAQRLLARMGVDVTAVPVTAGGDKLLTVGSVLHEARAGDFVWGSGVNGKTWVPDAKTATNISFHSVRGPISRLAAREMGHHVPECYGDPGLLFPILFHDEIEAKVAEIRRFYEEAGRRLPQVAIIPNINDERYYFPEREHIPPEWLYITPFSDPIVVAACIRLVEHVVSSSLHGIVFSDAYGKSVSYLASRFEPTLKYDDYFLGTGREPVNPATSLAEAEAKANVAPLSFAPESIAKTFPFFDSRSGAQRLITETPVLQLGTRYTAGTDHNLMFVRGWTHEPNRGMWSVGKEVELLLSAEPDIHEPLSLRVKLCALSAGKRAYEKLRVLAADKVLSAVTLQRNQPAIEIDLPLPGDRQTGLLHLKATLENPSAPAEFGLGEDRRELGVCIESFELRRATGGDAPAVMPANPAPAAAKAASPAAKAPPAAAAAGKAQANRPATPASAAGKAPGRPASPASPGPAAATMLRVNVLEIRSSGPAYQHLDLHVSGLALADGQNASARFKLGVNSDGLARLEFRSGDGWPLFTTKWPGKAEDKHGRYFRIYLNGQQRAALNAIQNGSDCAVVEALLERLPEILTLALKQTTLDPAGRQWFERSLMAVQSTA